MDLPEQTIDDLLKRLRRVEGQIRGIQQMLVDGRECRDVVTQISAASKALDQAGFKLVALRPDLLPQPPRPGRPRGL